MKRTDEEIKKAVVDQLFWDDRVDASDIGVQVSNGSVELTGTVSRRAVRQATETDAWVVSGVVSVDNKLEVEFTGEKRIPHDDKIRAHIENLLLWNSNVDGSQLDVSVDAGVVTLKGSVDALWKKGLVEDISDSIGVVKVINKLSVVPGSSPLDEAIAEDIIKAMDRNAYVNPESVNVEVSQGQVELSGSVPTPVAYRSACEAALFTTGVLDLDTTNLIIASEE